MNKTAKEMFEELGFNIDISFLGTIRYYKHDIDTHYYIRFHDNLKEISTNKLYNNEIGSLDINMKLNKAIQKHIEEFITNLIFIVTEDINNDKTRKDFSKKMNLLDHLRKYLKEENYRLRDIISRKCHEKTYEHREMIEDIYKFTSN